jgi:hypothetical protein
MKLLTLLFLSASLWAQTPCLNGDGPLQVGQERCGWLEIINEPLVLSTYLPSSWTGVWVEATSSTLASPQTQLNLECQHDTDCALIIIRKDGEELARMNMEGQWEVMKGTLQEALDVFVAAFRGAR